MGAMCGIRVELCKKGVLLCKKRVNTCINRVGRRPKPLLYLHIRPVQNKINKLNRKNMGNKKLLEGEIASEVAVETIDSPNVEMEVTQDVELLIRENSIAVDPGKQTVTNSNKLIRGFGDMTRNTQLLLAAAISKINPTTELPTDPKVRLKLKVVLSRNEIAELINIDIRNVRHFVHEAAYAFHSIPIKTPGNKNEISYINIAEESTFVEDLDEFHITFHNKILPELIGLSGQFTSYRLKHQSALHSKHAGQLYRIFKSVRSNGYHTFYLWNLDELSNSLYFMLGLKHFGDTKQGVDITKAKVVSSSYVKDFTRFRERILEPSIQEINEKTDIKVEVNRLFKKGRAVHQIRVKVTEKQSIQPYITRGEKLGVSPEVTTYLHSCFGPDVIASNLDRMERQAGEGKLIRNKDAYLSRLCRYNYAALPPMVDPFSDENSHDDNAVKFLDKVIVPVWKKIPGPAVESLTEEGLASIYIADEFRFFCECLKNEGLREAMKHFTQKLTLQSILEKCRKFSG